MKSALFFIVSTLFMTISFSQARVDSTEDGFRIVNAKGKPLVKELFDELDQKEHKEIIYFSGKKGAYYYLYRTEGKKVKNLTEDKDLRFLNLYAHDTAIAFAVDIYANEYEFEVDGSWNKTNDLPYYRDALFGLNYALCTPTDSLTSYSYTTIHQIAPDKWLGYGGTEPNPYCLLDTNGQVLNDRNCSAMLVPFYSNTVEFPTALMCGGKTAVYSLDGKVSIDFVDLQINVNTFAWDGGILTNCLKPFVYRENNLYGVINFDGKVLLKPVYKELYPIREFTWYADKKFDSWYLARVKDEYLLLDEHFETISRIPVKGKYLPNLGHENLAFLEDGKVIVYTADSLKANDYRFAQVLSRTDYFYSFGDYEGVDMQYPLKSVYREKFYGLHADLEYSLLDSANKVIVPFSGGEIKVYGRKRETMLLCKSSYSAQDAGSYDYILMDESLNIFLEGTYEDFRLLDEENQIVAFANKDWNWCLGKVNRATNEVEFLTDFLFYQIRTSADPNYAYEATTKEKEVYIKSTGEVIWVEK